MSDEVVTPKVGSRWHDGKYPTRTLRVTGVDLGSRQDRHVTGYVTWRGQTRDYACSIGVFRAVWVGLIP